MKTIKNLKNLLIISLFVVSSSAFAQDKIIPFSEAPASIQAYVSKHFPNHKVLQTEIDYEGLTKEYEVILSDNIKLEFDGKNNIKNIDAKTKLPDSVIPKEILDYVKANYPNNFIIEWDLDKTHQSVELNNDIELEFTLNGEFLRIDD
ncbi:MAG: PepSY-like domain-containing protein [Brumimicrobium sp.]|nr:PepSY-like domain-containing protein [Brumimicrobium sp.]